eukprot:gene7676-9182_t
MSVAAVKMEDDLDWSESQKGFVLSAFYWGYTIGQIPASRFCQLYGAKWIFGLSVLIPSALTLLVPVACRSSYGMALFIRVIIGFFESATFPAVFHFFPIWVPLSEKTFMIPFIVSGMYMGEIIGFSLSGALAGSTMMVNGEDWGGWPSIFYVFGACGLIWFPFWAYAAHESPAVHPYITKEEVLLINRGKDLPYDAADRDSDESQNDNLRPLMYDQSAEAEPSDYTVAEVNGNKTRSSVGSALSRSSTATSDPIDLEARAVHSPLVGRATAAPVLTSSAARAASADRMSNLSKEEWQVFPDDMYALTNNKYTKAELTARTPWMAFLTDPVARALLVCAFVYGWIGFTLLSEMPSYLADILDFDLGSAGIFCIFPYLALFFSTLLFARGFDYMQREKSWEVNTVRVTAMFITYMGSALGLIVCGFLDAKYAAYTFMVLTQVFYAAAQSGLGCIWSDVAPLYSSSLNSLANTIGAVAGIVGPIVVSAFVEAWPGVWGWRMAFLLTGGMCTVAMTLWYKYIKSEIRPELNTPAPLRTDVL